MIELQQNEKIILMRHKHWFVFVSHLLPVLLLYFLPYILFGALGTLISKASISLSLPFIDARTELLLALFWTLLIWILVFVTWTDYYLDTWILTDRRVIDIEQQGFFRRDVSSFRYEQIQDMTVSIHGIIPTYLNFGSLEVQTAGSSAKLQIHGVANPNEIRDMIFSKMDKPVQEKRIDTSVS
ncbi:MAG: Uncharacterized protein G01um101448_162 [Parcubacteria group bacterium Gr01-1014_48]|nr:MAG: Uncharacterized protein Greene041614_710 [Parcubacteria group bacterium Greene0416_14]TSC74347.1 MAG: Uncharacterized protein G01um101448_162 [Parcubacteria group bacterium Gr01-1014_48]TSD00736.1 MAG: Uncharacterized protein Greene101415_736 [Parcubacteria group bacterium Greene1014_15]TSD07858.1 MAG: Uncharacterized protein Greene07144_662 [Parcubacteria group bacterium Greene0714_4]